jgi:hypothetical protein
MSNKSYTLATDEKATQVMIGTSDLLLWGDLVTKEHARLVAFLATLAEAFVPLRDAKILFLAPSQKTAPIDRPFIHIKLEEILLFSCMSDPVPLPEESEVRKYEPVEMIVGSYLVEGIILKSPISTLQNILLVSKDQYLPVYQAKVRHVAKPWLGSFSCSMVQLRRDRLLVLER